MLLRLLTVLLLAAALGCGESQNATAPAPREGVISMAPHLTETIFALGAGDQVIAVGSFDDYPPEAAQLPDVGGYLDPKLEKISQIRPALMILPGEHQQVTDFARLNQIPILNVNMDSLESIDAGIATLGEALDAEEAADALRARLMAGAEVLREAVAPREKPKVLIITMRHDHSLNTLYTAGGSSFVSEIVELAGGESIYGDEDDNYLEASKETVVMRAPEVILEFHSGENLNEAEIADYRDDWQALPTLPAVRNKRVYILTQPHGLRPGPRILEIAREIAQLLHPDLELPE